MARDTIIIVEGPQGVGKTTITNYLREKIKASDLYRLHGIKDKTETGHQKIKVKYEKLLEYMSCSQDINMIFDRIFFSNEIYSRLGYFEYSFTKTYEALLQKLDSLDFDIYFMLLYLEDETLFETRIKREKHAYQKFDIQSSINQQREYLKMADEIEKNTKHIKVVRFVNDDNTDSMQKIDEIFGHLFL